MKLIDRIIQNERTELLNTTRATSAVVLSSRIRLARNLADSVFPGRANKSQRSAIVAKCGTAIENLEGIKNPVFLAIDELNDRDRQVLRERHLISKELCEMPEGAAVVMDQRQGCSVMINEEDHLRIQFLKSGFNLKSLWKKVDAFDSQLEQSLNYAFSSEYGYLTACPTNLGTGLRASVMMHLPGLVLSGHMERVVRAVNHLGITVRGLFGEGSEASGHVFQISNQQTLGESEATIIDRLAQVLKTVIDQEINARFCQLEQKSFQVLDQIGRSFGLLKNAYHISSDEAMNRLSFLRLAVDFKMLPDNCRVLIDRLFIACQPAHIQAAAAAELDADMRDCKRAEIIREELKELPNLDMNFTAN